MDAGVGRRFTLKERLRYHLDNLFSRGTTAMIAWLGIATFALILVTATIATLIDVRPNDEEIGFVEALWLNLLRTLDPGTMGGDVGWGFRIVSLIATLGGIFIVSSLIGLLASGINGRLEQLQRGKSLVIENGHTLILGWSPKIFTILAELTIANENRSYASAVILAEHDKGEMEDQIKARVPERRTTRIICRTGIAHEHVDLAIANPRGARSIILLNPEIPDGDAVVIKTALALVSDGGIPESTPIVAEIADGGNAEALRSATKDRVLVIQPSDIIARMTAQVSRQPGLSVVYQDLLDFDGDEIYFHLEPSLQGISYGDSLTRFETSSPIGIRHANGKVEIDPPMETVYAPGDQVIAVAGDDDQIVAVDRWEVTPAVTAAERRAPVDAPEQILMVGWNSLGPMVLRDLDAYVPPGSSARVVVEPNSEATRISPPPVSLTNLSITIDDDRRTTHRHFTDLLAKDNYQSVIILCYRDGLSEAQADAKALMTLLQILHASDATGRQVNVITELLDVRDVRLAPQATADHFVVSERLSSLLIVQLSENAELLGVFADLFDEEGAEIYLKPAEFYAPFGSEATYAAVVESGRVRNETVLGYRISTLAHDEQANFGVTINPPKSSTIRFEEGDSVIVLAEAHE